MKNLLIVNQSANYLMEDIACAFKNSGKYEKVVLMVGNPNNVDSVKSHGIEVVGMYPYERTSFKSRFKSWVIGAIQIVQKVRRNFKDYELFLVSNPPTIAFSTKFLNNKYSTLIYDVYPNGLSDGGFVKKSNIIYRIWSKRNKRFFAEAEHVYTITEGMKQTISEYCTTEKIEVVELWGDSSLPVLNIPKVENKFLIDNNLVGKFVVMYSGNIGKGHDLDVLVDVAERLKAYKDIVFLFVGQGYLKPIIEKKVADYGLSNVVMLPYQDKSILPYSLSCSDISVISTNKQSGKVCIPSKTFDLIKLGKPILCVAEFDSDISRFVKRHMVGESFSSDQKEGIVDFIMRMHDNPEKLKKYQEASLEAAKLYTSELANKYVK